MKQPKIEALPVEILLQSAEAALWDCVIALEVLRASDEWKPIEGIGPDLRRQILAATESARRHVKTKTLTSATMVTLEVGP